MAFGRKTFGSTYGSTGKLFEIDTTDFQYHNLEKVYRLLSDFYDGDTEAVEAFQFQLRGVYINNKSYFGDAPVIAVDDGYINIPASMTAECINMRKDPFAISCINRGEAGFTIYKYQHPKYGRICYNVKFCDYDPVPDQPEVDLMMERVYSKESVGVGLEADLEEED